MKKSELVYNFYFSPAPRDLERFTLVSIGHEIERNPHFYRRPKGWHVEHLIYTLKGSGIAHVGKEKILCRSGSILITPKDEPYCYKVDPEAGYWEYCWIEYDGQWVRPAWDLMGLTGIHHIPDCLNAEPLIMELFSSVKKNEDRALHVSAGILWKLLAVAEDTLKTNTSYASYTFRKIEQVKQFMHNNLSKPISVKCLAQKAGLSQFHFSRLFNKHVGMPPMKYLRRRRMAKAQELLHRNEKTVSDVGEEVGYPVVQHFTSVFKKEVGLTPGRYCRSNIKEKH